MGESHRQLRIWAPQSMFYCHRPSAQQQRHLRMTATALSNSVSYPSSPLFLHFKCSEEKELGSLTHMPSIREPNCALETADVPELLITEN